MSLNLNDIVGNIFHVDDKEKEKSDTRTADLQQKTNNIFGAERVATNNAYNPFLNKNGELFNPLLDYHAIMDNPNVSQMTKNYISQATGITKTSPKKTVESSSFGVTGGTAGASPSGNTLADAAKKYIGTPYVWGGSSASDGGMDCSGFVYNALKDAGYNIGRTSAQGYRSQGTAVSKDNMQPGDLVFYGRNDNASHIGIYLGDGKIVHSSGGSRNTKSNPGKGVSVTDVNYRNDFIEARRY